MLSRRVFYLQFGVRNRDVRVQLQGVFVILPIVAVAIGPIG